MKIIKEISIKNYKSFLEDDFSLESLTAIIGANESGKTNTLKAINEFSKNKQQTPFDNGDFRLGSPDFPKGEICLTYNIELNRFLIPNLAEIEPEILTLDITISKVGKLNEGPRWKVIINSACTSIREIVMIKNKGEFKKQAKGHLDKKTLELYCKNGWFFKDSTINLTTNPFFNLSKNKYIIRLGEKDKKQQLEELILGELLQNIKILFWRYSEDNYLHDRVLIEDFVASPNKFTAIDNIFHIGGWKRSDYRNYLIDIDITSRRNLLKMVEDKINKLIKKHWTTHDKLTISLSLEGQELTINLNEPGHVTPPNFRSDGFKWFLTFLLYFKRHAKNSLENYILLIDEPGVFLHPRGQKDILNEIKSISIKNQVIYSTHQTFLIDKNNPDTVRIIKRLPKKGIKSLYDSKVETIKNKKNIFSDPLLRESLGFLVSDISPINEKNVLVEGGFDKDFIITANQKFKKLNLNEISIVNCGKATNIKHHASLYMANDLGVLGVYESDDGGRSAYNSADKDSEKFRKIQFKDIFEKNIETIEDIVPDGLYKCGLLKWKKRLNISEELKGEKPRMKEICKYISDDREEKIEQKHALEEILLEEIKDGINKSEHDFSLIIKLLEEIEKRITK